MGGSIDPIEYDVAELRELARVRGDRYVADEFLWTELPESFRPADETAEYDRPSTWTGSLDERQKPYLRAIPDDEEGRVIAREWVEGLVNRAGSDAAVEALSYYESLGWITEAVREELEGYLLAVGYRSGGSLGDLTRADHVESLARTSQLAKLADPRAESDPESGTEVSRDGQRDDGGGDRGEDESDGTPPDDGDRWWDAAVVATETGDPPDGGAGTGVTDDTEEADDGAGSGFEFGNPGE